MATRGDTTWIVFAETTPRPGQGSPVSVVPYDRRTGSLGRRVLLAWSQPGNDGHAQPGIALDSLRLPARDRRRARPSLPVPPHPAAPHAPTAAGRSSRRCARRGYRVRAVRAPGGTPDLPRLRRRRRRTACTSPSASGARTARPRSAVTLYGALSYQRRDPFTGWTEPRIVVVPPYADYSIYTQALTAGSQRPPLHLRQLHGRQRGFRPARRRSSAGSSPGRDGPQPPLYLRRMVLVSADGGDSWRFAETADLTGRRRRERPRSGAPPAARLAGSSLAAVAVLAVAGGLRPPRRPAPRRRPGSGRTRCRRATPSAASR